MIQVKVPTVGESITEVTVGSWYKNDGDYIEMDEIICELESDKASFELNAESAGTLKIIAQEGDTLEVGDVICEIDETAAKTANDNQVQAASPQEVSTSQSNGSPTKTGETIEMKVPEVGESITEVTISTWLKAEGDFVELDEIIAEVDSDKATFELPAEATGFLHIKAEEGSTLTIGDLICTIEVAEGTPEPEAASNNDLPAQTASTPAGDASYAAGHASPAAGKLLDEKGIPTESVQGTGVGGRITKEDALKAEKKPTTVSKPVETEPVDGTSHQTVPGSREERRKKMSTLRRTIARRLVAVKNETAMLTTFNEVDMKPIMDLRKKYKESFKEKHGVGLGFMSFFTKACCMALQEWPAVNASIDGDQMVYHDYCDISIAVSTPRGLVVPVIRNAESMTFRGIESEIINLATKARDNKLSIEEMTGGTFTITNGGVFGSMLSTPIINSPQSAILGMHNIVQRPVVENGEVVVRPIMYVALSYDHRIIDGRESVSFLVRVKQLLEDPTRLLLEV